jgi:hypothetical protein
MTAEPNQLLRTADDILAAMKTRKEKLGLSDAMVDDLAGFSGGRWNKAFGPAGEKVPNLVTMMVFAEVLGVSFVLVEDIEKVRRMRPRWERRFESAVQNARRIASAAIKRALPYAVARLASSGGKAAWKNTTPAERRARMRELAMKRWAA